MAKKALWNVLSKFLGIVLKTTAEFGTYQTNLLLVVSVMYSGAFK
jgi:hypothetical protein